MTGNIICILIAIVVYLVGMVAIGVYYSKGQSTSFTSAAASSALS